MKALALLGIISAEILGFSGIGALLGYWIQNKWGGPAVSIVIGATIGLIIAFYQIYKTSQRFLIESIELNETDIK